MRKAVPTFPGTTCLYNPRYLALILGPVDLVDMLYYMGPVDLVDMLCYDRGGQGFLSVQVLPACVKAEGMVLQIEHAG
jgi:hypothetical protein